MIVSNVKKGLCELCREIRLTIRKDTKTGKEICWSCYLEFSSIHEPCCKCGTFTWVHTRTPDGLAICARCYLRARYQDRSKYEKCSECGEFRYVMKRNENKEPLCSSCYQKLRRLDPFTHEKCCRCGEVKPVHTRTTHFEPVCRSCDYEIEKTLHVLREDPVTALASA